MDDPVRHRRPHTLLRRLGHWRTSTPGVPPALQSPSRRPPQPHPCWRSRCLARAWQPCLLATRRGHVAARLKRCRAAKRPSGNVRECGWVFGTISAIGSVRAAVRRIASEEPSCASTRVPGTRPGVWHARRAACQLAKRRRLQNVRAGADGWYGVIDRRHDVGDANLIHDSRARGDLRGPLW